jgi:hypothetical protein
MAIGWHSNGCTNLQAIQPLENIPTTAIIHLAELWFRTCTDWR